jgi:hypothetical protein
MTRLLVLVLLLATTALGTEVASTPASTPSDQTSGATFNKDVLPVLQKNCQVCHRDGGIAPMSFTTYEGTRPWAKAIKAAVVSKQMPPWFADPHVGEFRNAPKLSALEIARLTAWADVGAPEGNAADRPADIHWVDGWRIQPDVVVGMAKPFTLSASGTGQVREFFVENPFREDPWVSAMEIRPGNPSVVHHVIVQVPELRSLCTDCSNETLLRIATSLRPDGLVSGDGASVEPQARGSYGSLSRNQPGSFVTMEAVYAPGSPPLDFQYEGSAKLIPGRRPIRIEVHYTPNGTETEDQTRIAFTLAKAPPQRRFVMMAPERLADTRLAIPPGASNFENKGELTFDQDAELVWFMPHMHLRGKDMSYQLIHPDGRQETVLSVSYNFNWQLGYEVAKPVKVTKGTRMIVTAHYDNSANNRRNPSPEKPTLWGEMTNEEMMLPWFGVVVDKDAEPKTIASYKPVDFETLFLGFGTEGPPRR